MGDNSPKANQKKKNQKNAQKDAGQKKKAASAPVAAPAKKK